METRCATNLERKISLMYPTFRPYSVTPRENFLDTIQILTFSAMKNVFSLLALFAIRSSINCIKIRLFFTLHTVLT